MLAFPVRQIPEAITVKQFAARLYPNPANSATNLSIDNPKGSNVWIQIFDVNGRKMATFNGGKANSNNISLPLQTLKAGTYWVEAHTEDESVTLQMIVTK